MMKKNYFKKMLILAVIYLGLNQMSYAQCSTSFTYTAGTSDISATSTSTGTTGITSYIWSLSSSGNPHLINSYGASPLFSSLSLYNDTYVLTLSLDSGGAYCTPSSQTITISGGVNAPVCSSNFTYTVGASGLVNFTNASPTDALNNTSYSWDFGNGTYSAASNATCTYFYNGTYTVTLNIHNSVSGCSISSTQTITITNANPQPVCTSNFTYTVNTAGQVDFTALYAGIAADSNSVRWNFGDGQNVYDSSMISHTYLYNGNYSVTLSINNHLDNCYSSTTQTVTITNTATQPCVPSVSFSMHQDSINPQPGAWLVSTYYSSQVTSAVWHWGDGTSTTGFSPAHTYTAAGHYNICVTVYSACGDSSTNCQNDSLYRLAHGGVNGTNSVISVTVINENATGISQHSDINTQVSVYPNPSTGSFQVSLSGNSKIQNASIEVYNTLGECIHRQIATSSNCQIDLQSTANGAYFMKVMVGDKSYTNKIIINK